METSCIVLAGGKSTRLGKNKLLEIIGKRSLLEQVIYQVAPLSREIVIVTAEGQSLPPLPCLGNIRVLTDMMPVKGPLVGIYTGLYESKTNYNLVVAGDMPFLNRDLLAYMLEIAHGYELVIPRVKGALEPLHAVYSRECLFPVKSMLDSGRYSVNELSGLSRARYVQEDEINRFDPLHLSFFNINTLADLEKAKNIMEGVSLN